MTLYQHHHHQKAFREENKRPLTLWCLPPTNNKLTLSPYTLFNKALEP